MNETHETIASPREQLELITTILQDSRDALRNTSFPYIVWGGVCATGTALSYILGFSGMERLIMPLWVILTSGATGVVVFYFARKETKKVKYFSSRIYSVLWGGISVFGLGLWLVSFLFKTPLSLQIGMAFLSTLIGLGYLVSSVLTNYRTLFILGILWGLGGMLALVLSDSLVPALIGSMAFFFEFIPGLLMYRQEKKSRSGTQSRPGPHV